MKKDVVKYDNRLNSVALTGFNAVDLDVFMLICSKVKDRETERVVLDYAELKKLSKLERKPDKYFHDKLHQMTAKLKKIGGSFSTENQFVEFNLFSTFAGDLDKRTLTVRVNEDFSFLLNHLSKNFTSFELREFVSLESRYSKNLYKLLKQYRRTGKYKVEAAKFRELMDCPKSYPNKEFMRVCVNTAVRELSRGYFDDLKVTPVYGPGRGRPIMAYEFTFKKSKDMPGQYNLSDYDIQEEPKKAKPNKNNRFNNFKQRDYDFDDLEKQLIQAQQDDLEG